MGNVQAQEASCKASQWEYFEGEHTECLEVMQIILPPLKITCKTRFFSTDVIVQTTNNITQHRKLTPDQWSHKT